MISASRPTGSFALFAILALAMASSAFGAATPPKTTPAAPSPQGAASAPEGLFQPESVASEGSVTVGGRRIDYKAVAGTLVVHPEGWDDAVKSAPDADKAKSENEASNPTAEASMFYVAYFQKGAGAGRPVIFLYNGGPGSSTVWLHMGAFGPRRVVTPDDSHAPAAPYRVVDNAYSLLDVADLVFIDAPGAGFSRIAGKDKEKAFWNVDADAHAFEQFILQFLSQYGRWNSPKYLFGESYGTPRSAVLLGSLTTKDNVDFNGAILLSQILNFDLSADGPDTNPGSDQAYVVALPTYAASAWYHNRLPGGRPADLESFLREVEAFAQGDYAAALQQGAAIDPARKAAVAQRMSRYIGLDAAYLQKANLRVSGGMFEKMLQADQGLTTGRLDTRFSGPDIDPLSKAADYDPQSAAIGSAYVSAFNDYARGTLRYGAGKMFKPFANVGDWGMLAHKQPFTSQDSAGALNVMPDLAAAMKFNPNLRILVAGGYYDLATPFFEGWYEMHHLPIPDSLQANIDYRYYPSGHMVYANEASLKALHDDVARFINATHPAR